MIYLEQQLKQADELEQKLIEQFKPYALAWRMGSRIKRKLSLLRKQRRIMKQQLEDARKEV